MLWGPQPVSTFFDEVPDRVSGHREVGDPQHKGAKKAQKGEDILLAGRGGHVQKLLYSPSVRLDTCIPIELGSSLQATECNLWGNLKFRSAEFEVFRNGLGEDLGAESVCFRAIP